MSADFFARDLAKAKEGQAASLRKRRDELLNEHRSPKRLPTMLDGR